MVDNQEQEMQGLQKLLSPPVFPDEEKTRLARLLHTILLVLVGGTLGTYLAALSTANPLAVVFAVSIMLVLELVVFTLLRLGQVRPAAALLASGLWLTLVSLSVIAAGISNAPFIALIIVVVIAGLLLGGRTGVFFALLSSIAGLVLLFLELIGLLPQPLIPFDLAGFWISLNVIFFSVTGIIFLTRRSLQTAVERARASERAQAEANIELLSIRDSLEQQVAERTQALEQRSRYLQASIEVSRSAASILDTDQLIQQIVNLIREQFGLYYVGLFLTDARAEWAVLRAGTGLAGKAMLERGHRIQIGTGMIGWSIANAQPRLALVAGEDAVRLATPELPETRSEAAIPLRSRAKVLGALTVQSDQPNAFGEMEIAAFQAMADQVATALDNAHLFEESQQALEEAHRAYGEISRQAWREFLHSGAPLSYRYDHHTITPIEVSSQDRSYKPGDSTLSLPIPVRDQVVGAINLTKEDLEQGWTEEEIALLETIVEQLGVALDSARLYQDTQRLALREKLTSEVTTRIRETLDIETVLRTTIQEVQRTLGVQEVVVSLSASTDSDAGTISTGGPRHTNSGTHHDGHKSLADH